MDNLICFLDHNGSQSFGSTKVTHPKFYPINKKVSAFNWDCIEVNGHNTNEINKKINIFIKKKQKKPLFVICNTVKGKGVKFMENNPKSSLVGVTNKGNLIFNNGNGIPDTKITRNGSIS